MTEVSLFSQPLFTVGPFSLTETVITSWALILLIWFGTLFIRARLAISPGRIQTLLEGIVSAMEGAIDNVAPNYGKKLLPFVGSLWVYLVIANLAGLVPGLHSPTRDLSATTALAFLVFLSTHWFGIREQGLKRYLRHYLAPSPILLPFHIISEITRSVALAIRLFGNIMSLEIAAMLVLLVAGFLAPVPILMLHVVEALVQAYIFGMLALIYIAGGLQVQQLRQQKTEGVSHA